MNLELNKLINSRYILFRHVASGGMADIYEAQDVVLNKPVALKFLKEKFVEDADSLEQFKNESRFISIFNHQNILKIYNVGEYYFVALSEITNARFNGYYQLKHNPRVDNGYILLCDDKYSSVVQDLFSKQLENHKNVTASLGLGIENLRVREGDQLKTWYSFLANGIPITERARQLRGGLFATISPALTYDSRDSAMFARKGTYANVRFDQAIGITDLQSSFSKISGTAKQYIPVANKSTLILTAKAGGKIVGDMPEAYAFRLGGPYTIRGFNISGVGTGNAFMMASGELQTPLFFLDRIKSAPFLNNVKAAFFVDAGRVFGESITDKIYRRPISAITAGVGLRVFIPGVGPLSIDYGMPLTGTKGSRAGLVTFGVGDNGY